MRSVTNVFIAVNDRMAEYGIMVSTGTASRLGYRSLTLLLCSHRVGEDNVPSSPTCPHFRVDQVDVLMSQIDVLRPAPHSVSLRSSQPPFLLSHSPRRVVSFVSHF